GFFKELLARESGDKLGGVSLEEIAVEVGNDFGNDLTNHKCWSPHPAFGTFSLKGREKAKPCPRPSGRGRQADRRLAGRLARWRSPGEGSCAVGGNAHSPSDLSGGAGSGSRFSCPPGLRHPDFELLRPPARKTDAQSGVV